MPDFLTRRNGAWHFVRRVPAEFLAFDPRGIVRHSTKVRVADDRNGRRASRVAERFNEQLEAFWRSATHGRAGALANRYDEARHRARSLGFDYVENDVLVASPAQKLLERLTRLRLRP